MNEAEALRASLPEEAQFGYYELVYLPLTANLNVQKMWLLTSLNHAYANIRSTYALKLVNRLRSSYFPTGEQDIFTQGFSAFTARWILRTMLVILRRPSSREYLNFHVSG